MEKAVAIGERVALTGCGLVLTLASGDILGVLVGGTYLGGGISSAVHETKKTIEVEKINPESFLADLEPGVAIGALTSGIGAAGAASRVISKEMDDAIHGESDPSSATYIESAVEGAIDRADSHVSSNITKVIPTDIEKNSARIVTTATTAGAADASVQEINMPEKNQEEYDVDRTVKSAATGATVATGQEVIKEELYRANGEKVPEDVQNDVVSGYENLKKIPEGALERIQELNFQFEGVDIGNFHEKNLILECDNQLLVLRNELKTVIGQLKAAAALKTASSESMTVLGHQQVKLREKIKSVSQMRKATIAMLVPEPPSYFFMNEDNAHLLAGIKKGQVAFDIKTPGVEGRGLRRAVFDFDPKAPKGTELKFVGYTDDHDYSKVPNFGEGDYDSIRDSYKTASTLNSNFTDNQVIQNQ
ncbi:unnamed protein product [Adineta steineri]|uniref:Uncharacterized protein n=1 Tax=Adineta steineri TaxID=433720 RepID=A0A815GQN5_9BILA|nr:unnamed protein product [Adineta steineri]CAF3702468.1 unnamed protein product [Adineta steineri]